MKPFSKRDEERLIEAGREYYSTAFPNPERVGCPERNVLEALARGKLDRATAKEWDSHMARCSPCFNDYVALREELERSAMTRRLAAIAAVIVVATATWLVVRFVKGRSKESEEITKQNANVTYQANLLDLRNKAALRGAEPNGNESPAVLPREPLALSIYLPTGSEPGDYEVQVTQGPGQPLLKAQLTATLRDHITVLDVKLNLQQLQPGPYLFWIRQSGTSWSYYPVLIKAKP
jgi:hypothetical protein